MGPTEKHTRPRRSLLHAASNYSEYLAILEFLWRNKGADIPINFTLVNLRREEDISDGCRNYVVITVENCCIHLGTELISSLFSIMGNLKPFKISKCMLQVLDL